MTEVFLGEPARLPSAPFDDEDLLALGKRGSRRGTSRRADHERKRYGERRGEAPQQEHSGEHDAYIVRVSPRGIHHLGVAVDDLDAAVATYERLLGAQLERRETVQEQGVDAASLRIGESRVELLAALGPDTYVGRFLARRGPGMHHVAYEVDDIRSTLTQLAHEGAELIDEEPRQGLFGLQVAFVHPDAAHGVLSEIVAHA